MPNRDELAISIGRPNTVAPAVTADAWPIVCFCTLGALMTLYMPISFTGMMTQFLWG